MNNKEINSLDLLFAELRVNMIEHKILYVMSYGAIFSINEDTFLVTRNEDNTLNLIKQLEDFDMCFEKFILAKAKRYDVYDKIAEYAEKSHE